MAIIPPQPVIKTIQDEQAIIAWAGDYPAGTTFNIYWEAGTFSSPPTPPLSNTFEIGLPSKQANIRSGAGLVTIPSNTNIYVSVTSVYSGIESGQSQILFLSLDNAAQQNRAVGTGIDQSGTYKYIKTEEDGTINVTIPSSVNILDTVSTSQNTNVTVGTVPAEILQSPAIPIPLANRKLIVIQNNGTRDINIGTSLFQGHVIEKGGGVRALSGDSTLSMYAVAPADAQSLNVWEFA